MRVDVLAAGGRLLAALVGLGLPVASAAVACLPMRSAAPAPGVHVGAELRAATGASAEDDVNEALEPGDDALAEPACGHLFVLEPRAALLGPADALPRPSLASPRPCRGPPQPRRSA